MGSPVFLDKRQVIGLHQDQIRFFGGADGLRDDGLLESAVHAPINQFCYSKDKNLFDLAASYVFHLAKNHPFNDGNKRAGLFAALTFLKINGIPIEGSDDKLFDAMIQLTISEITQRQFSEILSNVAPLAASILANLYMGEE